MVTGCYPRTQTQYSPNLVEQPQSVQFFQGTLIDSRQASFDYNRSGGFGVALFPTSPYLAGVAIAGSDNSLGLGAAVGGTALVAAGVVPELRATEYTVCLDRGTYSAPGAPAAIIVVQNDYPDRYPNDISMRPGEPVLVRVVGNSGRVMRLNPSASTAPLVLRQPPAGLPCVTNGPMSVPLGTGYPVYTSAPADTGYHPSWSINVIGD
jgi:hypothetical protein